MQIKKKEVEKKIFKGAIKEFYKNGYSKTTMRDISERSGVPIGNIYRYYKNKGELYESIVNDVYEKLKVVFSDFSSLQADRDEMYRLKRGNYLLDEIIEACEKNYFQLMILFSSQIGEFCARDEFSESFYKNITDILEKYSKAYNLKIEVDDEFIKTYSHIYITSIIYICEKFGKNSVKLRDELYKFSKFYHPKSVSELVEGDKIII